MPRSRFRLFLKTLFGIPVLVLASSCVPPDAPRLIAATELRPEARVLLQRLALPPASGPTEDVSSHIGLGRTPILAAAAPPFAAQAVSDADRVRAEDCLTAAVYYEARSQSRDGQRAVAQVVLNRVRDRAFPSSVCGVVYQGATRRTGCQFSFTCDGSLDRPRDRSAWDRAGLIATAALAGAVYAPIGSATYYHATSVLPWWASSLTRIGSVGAHIFYRWRDGMERALAFRQAYSGLEPRGTAETQDSTSGVAVHYVADGVASVKIHRDIDYDDMMVSRLPTFGVKVHRGGAMPGSSTVAAFARDTTVVPDEPTEG